MLGGEAQSKKSAKDFFDKLTIAKLCFAIDRLSKNLAAAPDDRAAGELEGARPASSTIARRSKRLENQGFSKTAFCVRPKCSAGKAQSKKSTKDFFDKLGAAAKQPLFS